MIQMQAFLAVLAQNQAPPSSPLGNPLIMFALMAVMFYFLLIRPQQRQRKEQAARISALAQGDRVVTTAGIHGIIHSVRENTVTVKVAEGTFIEFDKPAIANVQKKDAPESK